jgi:G:T-mismatch repair DNA endonuclease (very short patch repair protein)
VDLYREATLRPHRHRLHPLEARRTRGRSFWRGHPSKWQSGRWSGYWDEKIKRNLAGDAAQNKALRATGWEVIRVWDFEVEHDPDGAGREPLLRIHEHTSGAVRIPHAVTQAVDHLDDDQPLWLTIPP